MEQYREQTGSEPDTTSFNKPGSFTGPANQMTTSQGKITSKTEGPLNEETVIKFDFSMEDGQDFHAAKLMVSRTVDLFSMFFFVLSHNTGLGRWSCT